MIDVVLFAGRILLVAFLYIFLFAVMKPGNGKKSAAGRLRWNEDQKSW